MATKKRLIDANNAQAVLVNMAEHLMEAGNPEMAGAVGYAAEVIGKQRTVDATLTVHAHWDEWWPGDCSLIMTGEEMLYQCSACTAKFSDVEGFQYCPHCGALMEGINHAESDDQA